MSTHRGGRAERTAGASAAEQKVPLHVEQLRDGSLLLSLPEGPRGRAGAAGQQGNAGPAGSGSATDKGCRVYSDANQTISNSTDTVITFNLERYDTDSMHSTTVDTGRITFNTPGRYAVTATVRIEASGTGSRNLWWRLNGATGIAKHEHPGNADSEQKITVDTIYTFNAGDYVELMINQTSGHDLNLNTASNSSPEAAAQLLAAT